MKHFFTSILIILFMLPFSRLEAQVATIDSPDGKLKLEVYLEEGQPQYTLEYEGKTILEKSPLGVITNAVSYTHLDVYKRQRLYGQGSVNAAGIWEESYVPYHGRSHGRMAKMIHSMHHSLSLIHI